MSMISKPRVLFLAISLLFHQHIEAVRNQRGLRRHPCRQESVRNPRRVNRACSPCPSGKYRVVGDDWCRTCRNCTAIHRSFSQKCGHHNNAVCGNCFPSYWDITANSEGGDGGTQYPCQHCSHDKTKAKQCSVYLSEMSPLTTESVDVTTTLRDHQKTNHSKTNRVQKHNNIHVEIPSQNNQSQPGWIVLPITSIGHLMEMFIVLIIFGFVLVGIHVCIKLWSKHSERERPTTPSYVNKVEQGYKSVSYEVGCPNRCLTPMIIKGCMPMDRSVENLDGIPACRETCIHMNEKGPFKDPNTGNGKTEEEEELLTDSTTAARLKSF